MNKLLTLIFLLILAGCQSTPSEYSVKISDCIEVRSAVNKIEAKDISTEEIDLPIDSLAKLHPQVLIFIREFETHVSEKNFVTLVPFYETTAYNIQKEEFKMSDAQFLYELLSLGQWNVNTSENDYQARINSTMSAIEGLKIQKYSAEKIDSEITHFESLLFEGCSFGDVSAELHSASSDSFKW